MAAIQGLGDGYSLSDVLDAAKTPTDSDERWRIAGRARDIDTDPELAVWARFMLLRYRALPLVQQRETPYCATVLESLEGRVVAGSALAGRREKPFFSPK